MKPVDIHVKAGDRSAYRIRADQLHLAGGFQLLENNIADWRARELLKRIDADLERQLVFRNWRVAVGELNRIAPQLVEAQRGLQIFVQEL